MNLKTMVPLIVALALGVVAAKVGKDMMNKRHGASGPGMKMAKQVVSKEDLAPGSTIKETDVVLRDVPSEGVPQYTFTTVGEVVGRVVTTQIVKGQAVLDTLLAPAGTTGGVQAMVPPGMRAVTLEVNEFSGVAGLLTPGSRVDVVQTIQVKGDESGLMAKTIVENLRVLAVGRRVSAVAPAAPEGDGLARSVTVLATTEQSEAIDLASHVGSPRLVLRNGTDNKLTGGKGVTVAELRGAEDKKEPGALDAWVAQMLLGAGPTTKPTEPAKAEVAAKPAPNYREVEVIRGGASTTVRLGLTPSTALTGGAEKLLGELPQD
jgi:pilus assembly protein CpaB